MKSISRISAKPLVKEQPEESKKEDNLQVFGEDEFTLEDLQREWVSFLDQLSQNGGPASQTLVLKQPYKLEGRIVTITLSNAFQQDILSKFHQELVYHLRKNLNNRFLEVKHEVTEVVREDMPYTNQDKFEYLMKLNPELRIMKEKFDLDPDF